MTRPATMAWDVRPWLALEVALLANLALGDEFYLREQQGPRGDIVRSMAARLHRDLGPALREWASEVAGHSVPFPYYLALVLDAAGMRRASAPAEAGAPAAERAPGEEGAPAAEHAPAEAWITDSFRRRLDLWKALMDHEVSREFAEFWQSRLAGGLRAGSRRLRAVLEAKVDFDFLDGLLGRRLLSPAGGPIVVNLVILAAPHAMRLPGGRIVMAPARRPRDLASAVVHELCHPPLSGEVFRELLLGLEPEGPVMRAYSAYSRGARPLYGNLGAYVEEAVVRGAQGYASRALGLGSEQPGDAAAFQPLSGAIADALRAHQARRVGRPTHSVLETTVLNLLTRGGL